MFLAGLHGFQGLESGIVLMDPRHHQRRSRWCNGDEGCLGPGALLPSGNAQQGVELGRNDGTLFCEPAQAILQLLLLDFNLQHGALFAHAEGIAAPNDFADVGQDI